MKEVTKEEIRELLTKEVVQSTDVLVEKLYDYFNKPEPKKFEVWKPEFGEYKETYIYITDNGRFSTSIWQNKELDQQRYDIGNVYPLIGKKAENHVKHIKAKKKLQDELAVMNAEANGGVEYMENENAEYLLYGMGSKDLQVHRYKSDFIVNPKIIGNVRGETTIGTLTEEEVRLAFGVFE